MISVRDLWKSYGDKSVLQGISFKADNGEIYCIIGPNGSGKTTALKIIDLLEEPDKGEVLFNNVNILHLKNRERITYRKRIAMVFQQPTLYNMKVRDNIALGLKIRKMDKTSIKEEVDEALRAVNLVEYRDKHAYTLSGGEGQRLCLAMALALKPELLLLDEPTANLDPTNMIVVEKIIKEYARKGGTVIFTTHNMFEAKRLASTIALLVDGTIIEEDTIEDFFNNPKDNRTVKFVKGEIVFG